MFALFLPTAVQSPLPRRYAHCWSGLPRDWPMIPKPYRYMSAHPFQIIDIVWRREKTGRGGVMRTVTSRGNDEACETRPLLTGQKQMIRNTNCSPSIIWSNKHQTIRTEGRCLSRYPKPKGKISCRTPLQSEPQIPDLNGIKQRLSPRASEQVHLMVSES
jgi:hypothetical protein